MDKSLVRGIVSNLIGIGLLYSIAAATQLVSSAAIALVINWAVCFVHALPNKSEKFFDATGSLTYLVLVLSALLQHGVHSVRQAVNPVLVMIWCIRLGSFLFARILRDGKDDRFEDIKKSNVRFLGVWTIQANWCFIVSCPALVVLRSGACRSEPGPLDYAGWGIWFLGFVFEVIADRQKGAFRDDPANKTKFITTGLWAYSRHPNYFGEIAMWIGISTSGSSCFSGLDWLAWLSPLTTWLLLLKVSGVPMVEAKGEKTWGHLPDYQWYMKNTPCIFPALQRPPPFSADGYATISF